MKYPIVVLFAALALAACSSYEKGDVTYSNDKEIRIKIGYNAANVGFDPGRQAAEHCEDEDLKAVWYGHDAQRNLIYRCE